MIFTSDLANDTADIFAVLQVCRAWRDMVVGIGFRGEIVHIDGSEETYWFRWAEGLGTFYVDGRKGNGKSENGDGDGDGDEWE